MSHHHDKSNPWKAYWELLGSVGKTFVIFTIIAALCATGIYCKWEEHIEQINNRLLSPWWTSLLLWIPLVIQVLVYWRLRKQISQAILDHKLRVYFRFYFTRMAFSLLAYTTLWLCYVLALRLGGKWIAWIACLPLICIFILMYFVIDATFIITRPSFQNDELLLTPDEVGSNYECMTEALKRDPDTPGHFIKLWLLKDRDFKIYQAVLTVDINHVDVVHLTDALNHLIRNRRFYDAVKTSGQKPADKSGRPSDDCVPKDIEQFNRHYLDKHLFGTEGEEPKKIEGKERAKQLKLDYQKSQRDGMAMFPFYTLVFFFSVFLCIAYLFGFAFAFDDKYVQLNSSSEQVALLMGDDLHEDSGRLTGSTSFRMSDFRDPAGLITRLRDPENVLSTHLRSQFKEKTRKLLNDYKAPEVPSEELQSAIVKEFNDLLKSKKSLFEEQRFANVALTDKTKTALTRITTEADLIRLNRLLLENAFATEIIPSEPTSSVAYPVYTKKLRKIFYFNSGGAGLQVDEKSFSDENKYISKRNNDGFADLLSAISNALDTGKRARVVLVGRADDNGLFKETTDSSSKTNKKKLPPQNTYASNQDLAATRIRTVRYELQRLLIGKELSPDQLQAIDWSELAVSNDGTLPLKDLKEEIEGDGRGFDDDTVRTEPPAPTITSKEQKGKADDAWKDIHDTVEVQAYLTRLNNLVGKLTDAEGNVLYNQIQKWKKLKFEEKDEDNADRKEDIIEEQLYRIENPAGSKRVVEVFFSEAHDSEQQFDRGIKRMALMDYLYFAMYTITTTGYGDIKPITPYSKFLCALANITEFFFIVVFFNTLLSLKRVKGDTV